MTKCKYCGAEVKEASSFCTSCGKKPASRSVRTKQSGGPKVGIIILTLIVVAVISFSVGKFLQPSPEEEGKEAVAEKKEEGEQEGEVDAEGTDLLARLEELPIETVDGDIETGTWTKDESGTVPKFTASSIPSEDLIEIFRLYDDEQWSPLVVWAKKIHNLLESEAGSWEIYVGNQCSGHAPEKLEDSELLDRKDGCGFNVPILTGTSKDDLRLIEFPVYGEFPSSNNHNEDAYEEEDYLLPDSDSVYLTEGDLTELDSEKKVRLARNEIFARHGYIFDSEELQYYFSAKSWYIPDETFEGELSSVEKHNIELLQEKEESL